MFSARAWEMPDCALQIPWLALANAKEVAKWLQHPNHGMTRPLVLSGAQFYLLEQNVVMPGDIWSLRWEAIATGTQKVEGRDTANALQCKEGQKKACSPNVLCPGGEPGAGLVAPKPSATETSFIFLLLVPLPMS